MENVKYILIVSQYYYSHHCFVVSAEEENYREKALSLIEKLEDYKRDAEDKRSYHYGRDHDIAYTDIHYRWNVNDDGDIYFLPCGSMTEALRRAEEYNNEIHRAPHNRAKARVRSHIEDQVRKHHSETAVAKLVAECFKVL